MSDTADYRRQHVGVPGSTTGQQVTHKNNEVRRSFFAARETGVDTALPGHSDNEDDSREL